MAKKPKRPKAGAPLKSWENYDHKVSQWEKDKKRKEQLIKKHRG